MIYLKYNLKIDSSIKLILIIKKIRKKLQIILLMMVISICDGGIKNYE